jgi:hypothetical protein
MDLCKYAGSIHDSKMMQSLQEFSYAQINETYMNTFSNMCFSQTIEHFLKECCPSTADNQVGDEVHMHSRPSDIKCR